MKKAIIVTALGGFIRSFLTNDIRILQNMGYEVHCAANINHEGNNDLGKYFEDHNVFFHQVDFNSAKPLTTDTIKSYRQIKKILDIERFDVIHVHTPIAGVICRWASRKYKKNGTRIIYTTHGFYFHNGASKKNWLIYYNVEKIMSVLTDVIITINQEDYKNAMRMRAKEVFYIPGVGVDVKKFKDCNIDKNEYRKSLGIEEGQFLILAVGELSRRKNHKVIIEAIGKSGLDNVVFMICGNAMNSDSTIEELRAMAKMYSVNLMLMGLRKDIPQLCKCADMGVMPSLREGLGLSGIEMIASGLPIVASRVHGIMDYVQDGVNGFLADPYSSDEFLKYINVLYDDCTRMRMSQTCIGTVDGFDKSKSFDMMERIYRSIL